MTEDGKLKEWLANPGMMGGGGNTDLVMGRLGAGGNVKMINNPNQRAI